jgi:hypothetical protein
VLAYALPRFREPVHRRRLGIRAAGVFRHRHSQAKSSPVVGWHCGGQPLARQ